MSFIIPGEAGLQADQAVTHAWLVRYNASLGMSAIERRRLLAERLAEGGEGSVIRLPFHCDYGFNIRIGSNVFLNFNCVILDVVEVVIGDGTQIDQQSRSTALIIRVIRRSDVKVLSSGGRSASVEMSGSVAGL